MSKHFVAALLSLPLILQIFNNCSAQDTDIKITVLSISPPIAEIRGRAGNSSAKRNFSITRDYAGFPNLADRVSDVHLEDKAGKAVAFKQFVAGEYVAADDFVEWSYKIDLTPQKRPAASAHISWIATDNGLLFLDDILPLAVIKNCSTSKIKIELPDGWTALGNGNMDIPCAEQAVYFLAKKYRQFSVDAKTPIDLVIAGQWKFTDEQAGGFVKEIFDEYAKVFGDVPKRRPRVYIVPFPVSVGPENWEADTRGGSVTILSSDMPFATQSLQRLHEQLRHEMFHLWMPNSVSLTGNYDWFYEGFALYESLRLGVKLNRLRFDDYLDTLGRAMTLDAAITGRPSLIEASKSRVSGNDTLLYARGMLIAFLTDMKMVSGSGGRRSVEDLLRTIYEKYRDPNNHADGNQAILDAIGDADIKRCVETSDAIDWSSILKSVGIEKLDQPGSSVLKVVKNPGGSQKKLLDKLGYNNWRNSSIGPK
jgi:hypothetical protein